jgi:hypothetical protein
MKGIMRTGTLPELYQALPPITLLMFTMPRISADAAILAASPTPAVYHFQKDPHGRQKCSMNIFATT